MHRVNRILKLLKLDQLKSNSCFVQKCLRLKSFPFPNKDSIHTKLQFVANIKNDRWNTITLQMLVCLSPSGCKDVSTTKVLFSSITNLSHKSSSSPVYESKYIGTATAMWHTSFLMVSRYTATYIVAHQFALSICKVCTAWSFGSFSSNNSVPCSIRTEFKFHKKPTHSHNAVIFHFLSCDTRHHTKLHK